MRAEEMRVIHDLRMPAQMMTGCAEMLKGLLGEADADARRYVDLMISSSGKLVRLLDEVMRASRVEDDLRLSIMPGDMAQAVQEWCEMAEPFARSRGVQLVCTTPGVPVVVLFDAERFSRVLLNLLSNAIKFTPAGGCVTVCLETVGSEVHLQVSDTGIGMPDRALRNLFDSGSVGLSIVQRYAQLHGGDVYAQRNLRGGMCFTVVLPAVLGCETQNQPQAVGD